MRETMIQQRRGGPFVLFMHVFRLGSLAFIALVFLSACSFFGLFDTKTFALQGTVKDAYTGDPIESAQVSAGETVTETDADGSYTIAGWTAEETLELSAPGYEASRMPLDAHVPTIPPDSEEDVFTTTLDLELRPTTLSGVVSDAYTDEPVEGAEITAQFSAASVEPAAVAADTDEIDSTDALSETTVTTDDEGRYQLEGLPAQFTLQVSAPEYDAEEIDLERTSSYDPVLRPNILSGVVTDQYSDEPIAGVEVRAGDTEATTDEDGEYRLEDISADVSEVVFEAEGYAEATQPLEETTSIDAALRPNVLEGVLVSEESGEPVEFATVIATETLTSTAVASTRIDNSPDGSFTLDGLPESGHLQVLAPGYRKAVLDIAPGSIPSRIELEPFEARALYVKTSTAAYLPERMELFFDTIDQTELNALVIDLKSDNLADLGLIYYESQVPIIQELGTSADLMDIRGILAEAQRRNIYTIARIHVFSHDNLLAETKPEWAAQNALGCVPNENRLCNGDVFYADWDVAWLDPWNRNVWDYNIQLGVEAAQMGFDEIQFDYIRFPSDASEIEHMVLSKPIDWRNNPQPMYENIATVMEQAHEAFNSVGAFFSVDIFGYAVWAPQANIGQNAEMMAPHADYIYPMVYPSHFWHNELGFENAAAHPYEIVLESMERGQDMVGNKRALMRPWLQDFTLIWVPDHRIVRYGVEEVRAQIRAAEEGPGTAGWAVWDPDNEYTLEAFRPAEE